VGPTRLWAGVLTGHIVVWPFGGPSLGDP
jgi:hypothetical protein